MALRAFSFLRARFELAFVRIRLVTVRTVGERQRLFEITVQVAFRAADLGMFSEQRVLGLRMVECKARQQLFPARRGVAIFAALRLERAFVRIDVAVEAGLEFHILITCRTARHIRLVAFLALHLDVQTRQRIAGLGVIELLGRLPVRKIMALQTIVPELAFVHIFVTRHAILRQTEKGLRKIFHLDECAFLVNHVARQVAFLAGNACMLALQVVPRQPVIKLFLRRLPVGQVEILAVVFQVAAHALFPIRIPHLNLRVIPVFRSDALRHLFMAIQAFEGRRAGAELMTARALRGPG